jgi:hypothetical protein
MAILALIEVYPAQKRLMVVTGILFVVFLIVFAAIRKDTGPDYGSYKQLWADTFETDTYDKGTEPIYYFLVYFLKFTLGVPFQALIILFALISISLKYHSIVKYSPYVFLSLLIYYNISFLNQDFGQIRQGLATGITTFSIAYIIDKNPIKFLLLVLIATGIHYTAFIFLLLYPLSNMRVSFVAMVFIWIGAFLFSNSFNAFETLLSFIGSKLFPEINAKAFIYLTEEVYSKRLGFTPGMVLRFVNLFIIYQAIKPVIENKDRNISRLLVNSYFIGGILFFMLNFNAIFATRFSFYFNCMDMLALPLGVQAIQSRTLRYVALGYLLLYVSYNVYLLVNVTEGSMLIPYKSIFE